MGIESKAHITNRRSTVARTIHTRLNLTFGGTGAIATQDNSDVVATRSDTGIYTLAYSKCYKARIRPSHVYSPLLTVIGAVVTACAPTSGTATVKTIAVSTTPAAADPASGDAISLDLDLEFVG